MVKLVMGGTEFLLCMLGLNQLHLHLELSDLVHVPIVFSEGPLKTSALSDAAQPIGLRDF